MKISNGVNINSTKIEKEKFILNLLNDDIEECPGMIPFMENRPNLDHFSMEASYYYYWADILKVFEDQGVDKCFEIFFKPSLFKFQMFIGKIADSYAHKYTYDKIKRIHKGFPVELYCLAALRRSEEMGLSPEKSYPHGFIENIESDGDNGGFYWYDTKETGRFWDISLNYSFEFGLRKIHVMYGTEMFNDIKRSFNS